MKKKPPVLSAISCVCLFSVSLAGCSADKDIAAGLPQGRETLTQVSTIDAILGGVYDGVMDYKTLEGYGDFGIGTFAGLEGEMLAFDGKYYQIKADGVAYPVAGSQETPFAAVTYFDTDNEWDLPAGVDYQGFQEFMDGVLPTENTFYAIRVDGTFSYIKTRSVPAQTKPYPPLVEVTKHQPEFEFNDVSGTLVGYRCPPYVSGVNVPGYHMHFLTENKDAGGHVLDFTVQQAVISIDETPNFLMILPDKGSDFYGIDLTPDKSEELGQAEK